jgi:hypothetical protein
MVGESEITIFFLNFGAFPGTTLELPGSSKTDNFIAE